MISAKDFGAVGDGVTDDTNYNYTNPADWQGFFILWQLESDLSLDNPSD